MKWSNMPSNDHVQRGIYVIWHDVIQIHKIWKMKFNIYKEQWFHIDYQSVLDELKITTN